MLRRIVFAAIVLASIDPLLLRFPFAPRAPLAAAYARRADGNWFQYVQFLDGVRAHTRPGERVAVLAPAMRWDDGYSYAYYRASYFLTGREVLPVVDSHDGVHPENLAHADVIAAWRARLPAGRFRVAWQGEGGVLVRR